MYVYYTACTIKSASDIINVNKILYINVPYQFTTSIMYFQSSRYKYGRIIPDFPLATSDFHPESVYFYLFDALDVLQSRF